MARFQAFPGKGFIINYFFIYIIYVKFVLLCVSHFTFYAVNTDICLDVLPWQHKRVNIETLLIQLLTVLWLIWQQFCVQSDTEVHVGPF